jgi:uncharacterized protein (UPF0264 family)
MAGLLVSVRDAGEALVALGAGAALIDVKEPRAGAMGRAAPGVLAAVLDAVAGARPVSAALGELGEWPPDELPPDLMRLSYVKWGLARAPDDWPARLARLRERVEGASNCRVVAVAYADHRRALAPAPDEVCRESTRSGARALLLDTWHKDGGRLVDWLSAAQIHDLRRRCAAAGLAFALAGALGPGELRALAAIRPDWFAVRGAACRGGRREETIDPERVRHLVGLLSEAPVPGG